MSEVEQQAMTGPGSTLKAAREARGLSLKEAAERMRLTPQVITDLEADDYTNLAKVYSRGYLRTYAQFLQLDVAALLEAHDRIQQQVEPAVQRVKVIQTLPDESKLSWKLMRFSVFALILLLLGLVLFWWFEQNRKEQALNSTPNALQQVEIQSLDGSSEIHSFQAPLADSQAPKGETEPAESVALDSDPLTSAQDTGETEPSSAAPVAPAEQPVAAEPEAEAKAAEPVALPALAEGHGQFVAEFSGECWLSVTDAKGKVLYSGTKRAGEQLEVAGLAPLAVRIGLTSSVAQATYNGEHIDFSHYGNGKTARLKLGQEHAR